MRAAGCALLCSLLAVGRGTTIQHRSYPLMELASTPQYEVTFEITLEGTPAVLNGFISSLQSALSTFLSATTGITSPVVDILIEASDTKTTRIRVTVRVSSAQEASEVANAIGGLDLGSILPGIPVLGVSVPVTTTVPAPSAPPPPLDPGQAAPSALPGPVGLPGPIEPSAQALKTTGDPYTVYDGTTWYAATANVFLGICYAVAALVLIFQFVSSCFWPDGSEEKR